MAMSSNFYSKLVFFLVYRALVLYLVGWNDTRRQVGIFLPFFEDG